MCLGLQLMLEGMTAPIERKLLGQDNRYHREKMEKDMAVVGKKKMLKGHNNRQIAKIDITHHEGISGGKNSLEKYGGE